MNITVEIGKLKLKNPILTASGTFGYGQEFEDFFDPSILGAIITKGTTLEPREGNNYPRMAETSAGMLNAVGLLHVELPPVRAWLRGLSGGKGDIPPINAPSGNAIPSG